MGIEKHSTEKGIEFVDNTLCITSIKLPGGSGFEAIASKAIRTAIIIHLLHQVAQ